MGAAPKGEEVVAETGGKCFRYGLRVEVVVVVKNLELKDLQRTSLGATMPLPAPFLLGKRVEELQWQGSAPPPPQEQ